MATKKITKDTTLQKILEIKGAEEVLAKHNTPCLTCPMASMELEKLKIGEVSEMYGLDLKNILKDLQSLQK
jgi:hypothetical protein